MEKPMKDRLNEIIEKKGLTATKFASLIDANPSAISHLLKGRNKPGYDLLVNIAKAFPDISMDWLLTGNGEMLRSEKPLRPLEKTEVAESKKIENTEQPLPASPVMAALSSEVAAVIPSRKNLKRIILFFQDGSFEDYLKD